MSKLLCFNDLTINSKVVSNFLIFSLLYILLLLLYYYLFYIIYLLPTTLLYILLYINTLEVGSKLIFLLNQLTTLLLFIYRKILYVNITEYNNIDTFIKLIRQCNNLYKHWYIEKSYIYMYTHIRTWYNTYTCVHVRTRTHVHAHTRIYIHVIHIYFSYILCKNCTKIT